MLRTRPCWLAGLLVLFMSGCSHRLWRVHCGQIVESEEVEVSFPAERLELEGTFVQPEDEPSFTTTLTIGASEEVHRFSRPDTTQTGDFCLGGVLLGYEAPMSLTIPVDGEPFTFEFEEFAWIERLEGEADLGVYGSQAFEWPDRPAELRDWSERIGADSPAGYEPVDVAPRIFGVVRSERRPAPPRFVLDVIAHNPSLRALIAVDGGIWVDLTETAPSE